MMRSNLALLNQTADILQTKFFQKNDISVWPDPVDNKSVLA